MASEYIDPKVAVREDVLMKRIMKALGGSYEGIQTPVWRHEEELAVLAKALATVIPAAYSLPDLPVGEEDGTYLLTCTVADGEATLSWEAVTPPEE